MPYKDKEKDRARKREWYQKNKAYHKQYAVTNYQRIADNFRLSHVKRLYNLDAAAYFQMVVEQENKCKICGKPETAKNKKGDIRPLCVDHCHATGIVRGLLCNRCNSGLGNFSDNEKLLEAAKQYLLSFKEKDRGVQ